MHRRKRARRPMRPVLFDRRVKYRAKLPVILVNKLRPRTITRSVIKPDMRVTVGLPGAFYFMKKLKGLHPLWYLLAERIPCIGACSWCEHCLCAMAVDFQRKLSPMLSGSIFVSRSV